MASQFDLLWQSTFGPDARTATNDVPSSQDLGRARASAIPTSMPGDFPTLVERLLQREGGYSDDPADRGGATNYGISSAANPDVDVTQLSKAGAVDIYRRNYWDAINADALPPEIREIAFDAAVNHGPGVARRLLAQSGGDPQKMLALRQKLYEDIAARDPSQRKFSKGWRNRLAALSPVASAQALPVDSQSGFGEFDPDAPFNAAPLERESAEGTPWGLDLPPFAWKEPEPEDTAWSDFGKALKITGGSVVNAGVGGVEYGLGRLAAAREGEASEDLLLGAQGWFGEQRRGIYDWQKSLFESMSPDALERVQRQAYLGKDGDPSKTLWQGGPSEILSSLALKAAVSVGPTLAPLVPAALLARIGAAGAASTFLGMSEGLMSTGLTAADIAQGIDEAKTEDLMKVPRFAQLMNEANGDERLAKQLYINEVQGLTPAVVGLTVGAIAKAVGLPLDKVFGVNRGLPLMQRTLVTGGVEAAQEAPQSAAEQIAQNYAQKAYDSNVDLLSGVANSAIEGALLGFPMGGAFGGMFGVRPKSDITPDATSVASDVEAAIGQATQPPAGPAGPTAPPPAGPTAPPPAGPTAPAGGEVFADDNRLEDDAVLEQLARSSLNRPLTGMQIPEYPSPYATPPSDQAAIVRDYPLGRERELPSGMGPPASARPLNQQTEPPLVVNRENAAQGFPAQTTRTEMLGYRVRVKNPDGALVSSTLVEGNVQGRLQAHQIERKAKAAGQSVEIVPARRTFRNDVTPRPEPAADIFAQIRDMRGESEAGPTLHNDRLGVYLTRETMEHLQNLGMLDKALSLGSPMPNVDTLGGVLLARDEAAAREISQLLEGGAGTLDEILGYATGAGRNKAWGSSIVVQKRDEDGNVIRERSVRDQQEAQQTVAEFGDMSVVLPLQAALQRRQQRFEQEQQFAQQPAEDEADVELDTLREEAAPIFEERAQRTVKDLPTPEEVVFRGKEVAQLERRQSERGERAAKLVEERKSLKQALAAQEARANRLEKEIKDLTEELETAIQQGRAEGQELALRRLKTLRKERREIWEDSSVGVSDEVDKIDNQIAALRKESPSPERDAKLVELRKQRNKQAAKVKQLPAPVPAKSLRLRMAEVTRELKAIEKEVEEFGSTAQVVGGIRADAEKIAAEYKAHYEKLQAVKQRIDQLEADGASDTTINEARADFKLLVQSLKNFYEDFGGVTRGELKIEPELRQSPRGRKKALELRAKLQEAEAEAKTAERNRTRYGERRVHVPLSNELKALLSEVKLQDPEIRRRKLIESASKTAKVLVRRKFTKQGEATVLSMFRLLTANTEEEISQFIDPNLRGAELIEEKRAIGEALSESRQLLRSWLSAYRNALVALKAPNSLPATTALKVSELLGVLGDRNFASPNMHKQAYVYAAVRLSELLLDAQRNGVVATAKPSEFLDALNTGPIELRDFLSTYLSLESIKDIPNYTREQLEAMSPKELNDVYRMVEQYREKERTGDPLRRALVKGLTDAMDKRFAGKGWNQFTTIIHALKVPVWNPIKHAYDIVVRNNVSPRQIMLETFRKSYGMSGTDSQMELDQLKDLYLNGSVVRVWREKAESWLVVGDPTKDENAKEFFDHLGQRLPPGTEVPVGWKRTGAVKTYTIAPVAKTLPEVPVSSEPSRRMEPGDKIEFILQAITKAQKLSLGGKSKTAGIVRLYDEEKAKVEDYYEPAVLLQEGVSTATSPAVAQEISETKAKAHEALDTALKKAGKALGVKFISAKWEKAAGPSARKSMAVAWYRWLFEYGIALDRADLRSAEGIKEMEKVANDLSTFADLEPLEFVIRLGSVFEKEVDVQRRRVIELDRAKLADVLSDPERLAKLDAAKARQTERHLKRIAMVQRLFDNWLSYHVVQYNNAGTVTKRHKFRTRAEAEEKYAALRAKLTAEGGAAQIPNKLSGIIDLKSLSLEPKYGLVGETLKKIQDSYYRTGWPTYLGTDAEFAAAKALLKTWENVLNSSFAKQVAYARRWGLSLPRQDEDGKITNPLKTQLYIPYKAILQTSGLLDKEQSLERLFRKAYGENAEFGFPPTEEWLPAETGVESNKSVGTIIEPGQEIGVIKPVGKLWGKRVWIPSRYSGQSSDVREERIEPDTGKRGKKSAKRPSPTWEEAEADLIADRARREWVGRLTVAESPEEISKLAETAIAHFKQRNPLVDIDQADVEENLRSAHLRLVEDWKRNPATLDATRTKLQVNRLIGKFINTISNEKISLGDFKKAEDQLFETLFRMGWLESNGPSLAWIGPTKNSLPEVQKELSKVEEEIESREEVVYDYVVSTVVTMPDGKTKVIPRRVADRKTAWDLARAIKENLKKAGIADSVKVYVAAKDPLLTQKFMLLGLVKGTRSSVRLFNSSLENGSIKLSEARKAAVKAWSKVEVFADKEVAEYLKLTDDVSPVTAAQAAAKRSRIAKEAAKTRARNRRKWASILTPLPEGVGKGKGVESPSWNKGLWMYGPQAKTTKYTSTDVEKAAEAGDAIAMRIAQQQAAKNPVTVHSLLRTMMLTGRYKPGDWLYPIMQRLLKLNGLKDVKVYMDPNRTDVAIYDEVTHSIVMPRMSDVATLEGFEDFLGPMGGLSQEVWFTHAFVHEALHATAYWAIRNDRRLLTAVNELRNIAQSRFDEGHTAGLMDASLTYGLKSADEFISEAFSNPFFQQWLKSIKFKENETLWSRFLSWLHDVLIVGIDLMTQSRIQKPINEMDMMDALVTLSPHIFNPTAPTDVQRGIQKIKQSEGQQLPWYHGSPNNGIKQFRGTTFVTDVKEQAEHYALGKVFRTGKTEKTGSSVYEVRFPMGNLFSAKNPTHVAQYEEARARHNAKLRDPDDFLPSAKAQTNANAGELSFGYVEAIKKLLPQFDGMYVAETGSTPAIAIFKPELIEVVGRSDTSVRLPRASGYAAALVSPLTNSAFAQYEWVRNTSKEFPDAAANASHLAMRQMSKAATQRQLGDVFKEKIPGLKPYLDAFFARNADAAKNVTPADQTSQEWTRFESQHGKAAHRFSSMLTTATTWGIHPDAPFATDEEIQKRDHIKAERRRLSGKRDQTAKAERAALRVMEQQLDASPNSHLRSDEERATWQSLRDDYNALKGLSWEGRDGSTWTVEKLYSTLRNYYSETMDTTVRLMLLNALRGSKFAAQARSLKEEDIDLKNFSKREWLENFLGLDLKAEKDRLDAAEAALEKRIKSEPGMPKEERADLRRRLRQQWLAHENTIEELRLVARMADMASLNRGPYFPLMRPGKWAVYARQPLQEEVFDTREARRDRMEELSREDPTIQFTFPESDEGYVLQPAYVEFRVSDSHSDMVTARKELLDDGFTTVSDVSLREQMISSEAAFTSNAGLQALLGKLQGNAAAQQAIRQWYINSLSDRSFRKREAKRKKIAGVDPSGQHRTFTIYAKGASYYTAQLRYGDKMAAAKLQMQEAIKNNREEQSGISTPKMQTVVNEIGERDDLATDVPEPSWFARRASEIGQFMLLLTPSYWLLNASQPWMITSAVLGAHSSMPTAFAALARAQGRIFSPILKRSITSAGGLAALFPGGQVKSDEAFSVLTDVEASIRKNMQAEGKDPTPILDMLDKLKLRSIIDVSFVAELRDIASGRNEKIWSSVMDASRVMAHLTEVNNRIMTAMAAYDVAVNSKGMTHDQAIDFTDTVLADTQFDYSAMNTARMFSAHQSWWRPLVFQFMKYVQHMYVLFVKHAYMAFKGATPEQRKQGRMVVLSLIGMHWAATGLIGVTPLPAKWAFGLAMLAFPGDDEDRQFKHWISGEYYDRVVSDIVASLIPSKTAAKTVRGGLPYGLANVDLTNRMAFLSPYMVDINAKSAETLVGSLALSFGGPGLSIAGNMFEGAKQITEGDDPLRAFEKLLPKFARDVWKTQRLRHEGMKDVNGRTLIDSDDITPVELFLTATGFTPSRFSELQQRNFEQRDNVREMEEQKARIFRDFRAGRTDNTINDMIEFRMKYPRSAFTYGDLLRSKRQQWKSERNLRTYGVDAGTDSWFFADENETYDVE